MSTDELDRSVRRALERARAVAAHETTITLEEGPYRIIVMPRYASNEEEREIQAAEIVEQELSFDRPWKQQFIEWLKKGRTISMAAELAGVAPRHAYRCWHTDLKFRRAWEASKIRDRRR